LAFYAIAQARGRRIFAREERSLAFIPDEMFVEFDGGRENIQ